MTVLLWRDSVDITPVGNGVVVSPFRIKSWRLLTLTSSYKDTNCGNNRQKSGASNFPFTSVEVAHISLAVGEKSWR